MKIQRVSNGYVATSEEETVVFEDQNEWEGHSLKELLHYINETFGSSSRYDAHRIYILDVPGDKYEGELTDEQRMGLDLVRRGE